mmetsp:Transcript_93936/g.186281  ORF Transcript_93936/g.186281 Transcript_93936/m.186281 type:complete len:261 (+) Transcript_93936:91-873(+)
MPRSSSVSPIRDEVALPSLDASSPGKEPDAMPEGLLGADDASPKEATKVERPPPLRAGTSGIHALDQGQTRLWQGDLDGAIECLDTSLKEFFAQLEAQPEANGEGAEANSSGNKKSTTARRNSLRNQTALREHNVGQVVEFLCLCLSRKGDWEGVLHHADMILAGNYKINPDLRTNVLLRRAVALSHLAASTDKPPIHKFNEEMLEQAERDLLEVRERRPKDSTVACVLRQLVFLREQAKGTNHPQVATGGLSRIRELDI